MGEIPHSCCGDGCWSVGLVLGSGLGGMLAEPAKHYPTIFSESGLFGRFPYLLPNILGGGLALISLPMVFFFLEETMEAHKSSDSFKPIPPPEAELYSQEAAADERGGIGTTNLHNGYDPQLAISGGAGATTGSGGKPGCLTVGDKGSVQARLDKRLPLVKQDLSSLSDARGLEGGALLNVHGGARGNAQSRGDRIGEGEVVDPGGGEGQGRWRRIAFLQECLLPMKLLEQKRVRTVVFVYVLFSFLIVGFEEAYPLWTISSVATGGLDWTTLDVGQVLAACGGGMLIFQLLVYPRIVQRVGTTRSQRWSCCISIPVFLAYPFLSRLRDSEGVLKAASLILLFVTNVAGNAMFINLSLAINNAVDTSQRGTLNGLSMMLGSLASGAGPIVFSSIFAWSIYRHRLFPLDRNLVFCLFSLGMFIVTVTSWNVDISSVSPRATQFSPLPAVMFEETAGEVAEKGLRSET